MKQAFVKGVKFPFSFQPTSKGVNISAASMREFDHIRESIVQILGTQVGERFMNPQFGSHLKKLVFEPNDEILKGLLTHYIIEAIRRWEKRVTIKTVDFDHTDKSQDHLLLVHIHYQIIASQIEASVAYFFHRE